MRSTTQRPLLNLANASLLENIFQYMGASRTQRTSTLSRGLSEISNISRGSVGAYNHATFPVAGPDSMGQAIRQPLAPPETSILQRHDGFARFLKQHASPPHHRVTAGGRIVPTGPSSPPPMFDFASLNGLLRERSTSSKSAQNEGQSTQKSHQHTIQAQILPSINFGGFSQAGSIAGQQMSSANSTQLPMSHNAGIGLQPLMTPVTQNTTALVPMAVFPDGSTLVLYNGTNYRTYWNGVNLVMEPLNATPLPTASQAFSVTYPQMSDSSFMDSMDQPVQVPNLPIALGSATNESHAPLYHSNGPSQVQAADREEDMRAQLSNLDKHLALYHYDITPAERTAFIAQRRHLVEEIDKRRVSREQTKRTIPIVNPTARASTVPGSKSGSTTQENTTAASGIRGSFYKLAPTKEKQSTKCLSPAALPFIPMSMQNNVPPNSKFRSSSEQIRRPKLEEPRTGYSTLKIKDVATAAMNRKAKIPQAQQQNSPVISHRVVSSSSSVLDPSDPAMRIIELEDVEYAARYLYNWGHDKKMYCTTVEEFQEAIRRVREQARMYGCAGGSSKDPAYDAEQDLWWAICDRDPIPLPTNIPDHITNPRPWNWNNSAFNYRRQGAPSAGPACEHARSSPRLSGWDAAVTESMKDIMDVSRSYYALKGQLPSVPFRDFAYDRSGNKVRIAPETTAPEARFGAARVRMKTNKSSGSKMISPTPHDRPNDSKGLKNLTHNEVNGRRTGQPGNAQAKSGRKKNLTDGDAIRPVPVLCEDNDPKVVHCAASGTQSHAARHLPQTCPEDGPATPVGRHLRTNSKGSPTPRKDISSSVDQSTNLNNGDDKVGYLPHSVHQHVSELRAYAESPYGSKDPSYSVRRHLIPPEYMAGPKALHPVDPDGGPKVLQVQTNDRLQHSPGPSRSAFQSARENHHESLVDQGMDPAQTRCQWGPEDNTPSPTNHDRLGNDHDAEPASSKESVKAAKVSIPRVAADRYDHHATSANELRAINVTKQVFSYTLVDEWPTNTFYRNFSTHAHNFLRKMLKSPPYTAPQAPKTSDLISAALKDRMNRNITAEATDTTHYSNKEEPVARGENQPGGKFSAGDDKSSPTSPFKSLPNASINKAQASLASSKYQVHGFLPHSGGTGSATSFIFHDPSSQIPHSPVRVRIPSHETHRGRETVLASPNYRNQPTQSVHGITTDHHLPVNFGFDGGADSPTANNTNAASSNQHTDPNFDYRGVTTADYETQRKDCDSTWHQGRVEDFFQELGKREQKEILAHRVNAKRAA